MPRKKTEATIVVNCSPSTKEGWSELYKVGILSAELLSTWYKGDGMDKALGLRILDLKDKEREGWLALTPPEYAGAAKCSLMTEQLRYELGETNKMGMAELCAITDREIELSADEWKDQLLTTRNHNRRERKKMMPVCSNVACGKPIDVERPLCCAQCKVAVYCDRDCQKEAWKAGHKGECTPYVPPVPAEPAARESGKTPQASSSSAKKDPSMRGMFDRLKVADREEQSASMVAMFQKLSCAEHRRSVFESPVELHLSHEQVINYVHRSILESCSRDIHETYDLMVFEGEPSIVMQIILQLSARMREVRPLVFVCKAAYTQLYPLWRQNNVDLYKLKITMEEWSNMIFKCRTLQRELKTAPAPGMMRMLGFAGNTPVVAEVPLGHEALLGDVLMLN